ncbi:uncharacterized protein LOC125544767 isoform X1 [Triticum urartu]|uniref:uncharacterized protein LOC125544767 isoform X1 n=1 Tax=Triticum urartu TaxID=4572 RepID=UPI002044C9F8|nr:uncharacterized protein LOC125544767 isoform X1 [Triticum urartu]
MAVAAAEAEVESYINYLLMDMREAEEAQEEAERRKRGGPGRKIKKRKTETGKSSKAAAAAAAVPVEMSVSEVGSSPAESDLARTREIVEAATAKILARMKGIVIKEPAKTMTEEDVAAAAVYKAKAEEARRNEDRPEESSALRKWIATGDPEAVKCRKRWIAEDMEALRLKDMDPDEDTSDWRAFEAKEFREFWEYLYPKSFGNFKDNTRIPNMLYTDKKSSGGTAHPIRTLQVFSVKVAGLQDGVHWPLQVFGVVAARDCLDHNRNVIFQCERDNCQMIRKENPYLTLTGPSRAIVVVDPVWFEVALKVKGATESEDKELSYHVDPYYISGSMNSYVFNRVRTSRLSTMELTLGDMVHSVEATISVRVVGGEWPQGFRGVFTATTASIDDEKIKLLGFRDDKLPVAADSSIQLSRSVVSVEDDGQLRVSVMARHLVDRSVRRASGVLAAKTSSRSYAKLEVFSCKMEVTVAWSLLPYWPHYRDMPCPSI